MMHVRTTHRSGSRRYRGAAAVMAMMFLTIMATLSVAMFSLSSLNMAGASNLADADQARATAESGLRWIIFRVQKMPRPKTDKGIIDQDLVDSTIWPALRTAIVNDLSTNLSASNGRGVASSSNSRIISKPIALDDGKSRFVVQIDRLARPVSPDPLGNDYHLQFTVTGTSGSESRGYASRSVSMKLIIQKKINFAVVGKVPIQLGHNTLVEGPVAMTTSGKYPPLLSLSDFNTLTPTLTNRINAFRQFVEDRKLGYSGRITPSAAATAAGFVDSNDDGMVDEYDLFLTEFDDNGDKRIGKTEFEKSSGVLYDANLFAAMDSLGAPLTSSDPIRPGLNDGYIDNTDLYAKVTGNVQIASSESDWSNNLTNNANSLYDLMGGPIDSGDPLQPPITFSADVTGIQDLTPTNFNTKSFRDQTGTDNGPASHTTATVKVNGSNVTWHTYTNTTLTAAMANTGTANEHTPYGSTSWQATYARPVFKNMTFKNCRIPKGLNALFDNCQFQGVTYVELQTNITTSSGSTTTNSSTAMDWSKRALPSKPAFNANTALTSTSTYGSAYGNNLRFNDCVLNGPVAAGGTDGSSPTAYTHFANSWEFTGATQFDNQETDKATIVASQTNIEMGSFTTGKDPSTLKGVVVAGNIDIRGTSVVDGSIIVTGDGAGNTTLGYFGASDGDTDPTAMPEGGYGRLNIRYNPYRALPDGINIQVLITPDASTYREQ